MSDKAEITELLSLSARIGRDPLLVQASSGNTSIKLAGNLWIKASGKWLAHATKQETLIPIALAELRKTLRLSRPTMPPGVVAAQPGARGGRASPAIRDTPPR